MYGVCSVTVTVLVLRSDAGVVTSMTVELKGSRVLRKVGDVGFSLVRLWQLAELEP